MAQPAATLERPVPGVVPMTERQIAWQRRAVLLLAAGPLAGFVASMFLLWGSAIGPAELGLFLGFYVLTGLGVTVGYHRLLTHRSFRAPRWVRVGFAIAGSMSVEGSVITWVSDHRRHHAYADQEGDPHSPHLDDSVAKGLWHAHFGWLFKEEQTDPQRWAPDVANDRAMQVVDRAFPLLVILTFALPALAGWALTATFAGAVTGFVWGGLARVFFLNHITFSINSICHFYGKRPYETSDYSTNNWPLALLSFGESWHNNHHAFPSSAVHGLGRFQVDTSAIVIRAMERVGLATNVKLPSPEQLARRS